MKEGSLSIPPGGSYPVSGIINMRWPGQYVGRPSTDENLNSYFAGKLICRTRNLISSYPASVIINMSGQSVDQWITPNENLDSSFAGIGIVLPLAGLEQAHTLSSI